ncbi:zinc ABC transporter substrate-binding protein [Patescibacteria group bacterium]|nr:zinc ABC transporter substrate-binding protein [Patescibacteria group bacterium]
MKKKIIIILSLFLIIIAFVFIFKRNGGSQSNENADITVNQGEAGKVVIMSSLFPWYDLAKQIGGDKVEVSLLLPPGVGAHSFEPTPSDMLKISQADLFIYTGDYLEPWAIDLIASLGSDAPKSIALGEGLAQINNETDIEDESENIDHEEHMHSGLDPHIWLDPMILFNIAGRLTQELANVDPVNIDYYNTNLDAYRQRLENLDADYKKTLSKCEQKEFVYAGHYAFAYLANRYDLQYEAAQGFSPDAESNPQRLTQLTDIIKRYQLNYIFAAELDNPQLAESLAQEAGVKILLLNSAHNLSKSDLRAGLTYEEIMRNNLKQLSLGLKCQ